MDESLDVKSDTQPISPHAVVRGGGRCVKAPIACPKCGKTFTRKQALQYHDISQHTRSYTYKCHQCSKGFYQKYRFRAHMRKHAQNYQLEICTDCGKGFFTESDLRTHVMTVHLSK